MRATPLAPDDAYRAPPVNSGGRAPSGGGGEVAADGRPALDPDGLVRAALRAAGRVVLAVSGGRDSMALLHAAARVAPDAVAAVATFDHGTGPHAVAGVRMVVERAMHYGLACQQGCAAAGTAASEAAWRAARWRFLHDAAVSCGARVVVTAHSRDDQVETVLIRILRHAGARGLAALDIDGDVARPWLGLGRTEIARYASAHRLQYVEDPSNTSRAFLRNRVRLDLLPALRAVRPSIDAELLALASGAAAWRRAVERLIGETHPLRAAGDGASVAAHDLASYDAASLCVVWPVLAAQAGVTLDRRGTARLAEFTRRARVGAVMQLSGGVEVHRSRFSFVMRGPSGRTNRRGVTGAARAQRLPNW